MMKKADAFSLLKAKNNTEAARALGCTRQAVSQWPDELPDALADRVVAALLRAEWAEVLRTNPQAVQTLPRPLREALRL